MEDRWVGFTCPLPYLNIYHILTDLLGLDLYLKRIGYIPKPEVVHYYINLVAVFGRHIYAV